VISATFWNRLDCVDIFFDSGIIHISVSVTCILYALPINLFQSVGAFLF